MNQAQQEQLFQQTNLGLLNIRQLELNYYLQLNLSLGTQAALVGGFVTQVFTQQPRNNTMEKYYVDVWQDVAWITSSACVALCIHVIVCTMCMQVFGPGLALNGPVGSMARACVGMEIEQKQIIVSYILMMLTFTVSTTFSFWVVFELPSAIGSSVVFLIGFCFWFKYCERIYLRFFWQKENGFDRENSDDGPPPGFNNVRDHLAMDYKGDKLQKKLRKVRKLYDSYSQSKGGDSDDDSDDDSSDPDDPLNVLKNAMSDSEYAHDGVENGDEDRNGDAGAKSHAVSGRASSRDRSRSDSRDGGAGRRKSSGGFSSFFRMFHSKEKPHPSKEKRKKDIANMVFTGNKGKTVVFEGYLTKSSIARSGHREDPWERFYFVLNNESELVYFKSKKSYQEDPKSQLNARPWDLLEFYIEVYNSNRPPKSEETTEKAQLDLLVAAVDNQNRLPSAEKLSYTLYHDSVVSGDNSGGGGTGGGTNNALFQFTFLFRDEIARNRAAKDAGKQAKKMRRWLFRCDTEEELNRWTRIIKKLAPSCFPEGGAIAAVLRAGASEK